MDGHTVAWIDGMNRSVDPGRATILDQLPSRGRRVARSSASLLALAALATGTVARSSAAGRPPPRRRTPVAALDAANATQQALRSCTMAAPSFRATVDVEIANASDFCELVSHALEGAVFHAPVLVTPGLLWHYADAALSCRLRYRSTPDRMTIRNSVAACRWFGRTATGWHVDRGVVEAARRHRRALHAAARRAPAEAQGAAPAAPRDTARARAGSPPGRARRARRSGLRGRRPRSRRSALCPRRVPPGSRRGVR